MATVITGPQSLIRRSGGSAYIDISGAVILVPSDGQSVKRIQPGLTVFDPIDPQFPLLTLEKGDHRRSSLLRLRSGLSGGVNVVEFFQPLGASAGTLPSMYVSDGGTFYTLVGFVNSGVQDPVTGSIVIGTVQGQMYDCWQDVPIGMAFRLGPNTADKWFQTFKDCGDLSPPITTAKGALGKFHGALGGLSGSGGSHLCQWLWSSDPAGVTDPENLDMFFGRSRTSTVAVVDISHPLVSRAKTDPTQLAVPNSSFTHYLDDTPGSEALVIRAKNSAGTTVGTKIGLKADDPISNDVTIPAGGVLHLPGDVAANSGVLAVAGSISSNQNIAATGALATAGGIVSTTKQYTLSSSADVSGPAGFGFELLIRDITNGTTCKMLYENNVTPNIYAQVVSGSTFVTGAPGASQIQIKVDPFVGVKFRAGSGLNGTIIRVLQLLVN